jgi:pyroglutamyl-peptidase
VTTVLLTGFEPFDAALSNSSGDAVSLVAARWRSPETLVTAILPVVFAATLDELIATHAPDIVIATGLAVGRSSVTPERVAINLADARIPDNAGRQPLDLPIVPGGPAAYFSGLPIKAMVAGMRQANIPAELSQSAGTFVCNAVMYRLLHSVAGTGIRAGFIHVPASPGLAAGTALPYLSVETIADALEIAVRVSIDFDAEPIGADTRLRGGAVS